MDQDTTAQAPELLLGPLGSAQAGLLHQMLVTAYMAVGILKDGAAYRSPEWDSLDALWYDLHALTGDALDAGSAAREREVGGETIAAARRYNHLREIAAAEQLLAAERTASAA